MTGCNVISLSNPRRCFSWLLNLSCPSGVFLGYLIFPILRCFSGLLDIPDPQVFRVNLIFLGDNYLVVLDIVIEFLTGEPIEHYFPSGHGNQSLGQPLEGANFDLIVDSFLHGHE